MSDLICGKAAVGGNYNSTRDNINRPSDFTGHSLSVSDIVEIVRKDETKYYYCDDFGWTDITYQIPKEPQ